MTAPNEIDNLKSAADVPPVPTASPKNFTTLSLAYRESIGIPRLNMLSAQLGLSSNTLIQFGVGWSIKYDVYTIPMYNEVWDVVGILTRSDTGAKKVITGSAVGLFIPGCFRTRSGVTFITEGLTDAMAATEIGLNSIGRFNEGCGADMLVKLLAGHTVYIIADNGPAGIRGAAELQRSLKQVVVSADLIYIPSGVRPLKDLREMVCTCGKNASLNYILTEVSKHAKNH